MKVKLNLQTVLFLAFTVVALVPILLLSLWIQDDNYKKALSQVEDKHLLIAKNISSTLDRYTLDIEHILNASLHYHNTAHTAGHEHLQTFGNLFEQMGIRMIVAISKDQSHHNLLFGDEKNKPAIGLKQLSISTDAQQIPQTALSSQTLMNRLERPMIYIEFDKNNTRYIIALSTDYIIELQQSIRFGTLGHATIVDALGNVIAHPSATWQESIKNIALLTPTAEIMKGNTGISQFTSPLFHTDMIGGHTVVKKTGWGVIVLQPLSELKTEANNSTKNGLIIAMISLFIAFIIAYLLTKYLSQPITTILSSLKDLSYGKVTLSSEGSTNFVQVKEASELLKMFYRAALNVKKMQRNLEMKVEKRTAELQKEIKERKKIEDDMRHLATHDDLTGLPNRALFIDRLTSTYKPLIDTDNNRISNTAGYVGLLFLDLDKFKAVNDDHGHLIGDKLLQLVTARIVEAVRSADTVARQSGDEFVILLNDLDDEITLRKIATKITTKLSEPFHIDNKKIEISASIGGLMTTKKTTLTPEQIIQKADLLMYESKDKGGNIMTIDQTLAQ